MQLGCFGFITCFDGDSVTCKACKDIKICQKACSESLDKMNMETKTFIQVANKQNRWAQRLGNPKIEVTRVRENFQVNESDERIQGMSKNAVTLARVLVGKEVNFKMISRTGSHAFSGQKPNYLPHLLDAFANSNFSTRDVTDTLKSRLSYSESTAKTLASSFIEVLSNWKMIHRIKRGRYEVKL
jgi:hypothetical protein